MTVLLPWAEVASSMTRGSPERMELGNVGRSRAKKRKRSPTARI